MCCDLPINCPYTKLSPYWAYRAGCGGNNYVIKGFHIMTVGSVLLEFESVKTGGTQML